VLIAQVLKNEMDLIDERIRHIGAQSGPPPTIRRPQDTYRE